MKNLKKVLAFVVVFAMMFTFAASANTFPDVPETASYAEAVNILSSLGLMIGDENGNFNPDKILTRAEAATLVVRFRGLESAAEGAKGATEFTDVAADHWASGYINIATQTGIIVGMGDGTFRPEDQVTYEQIVKMIVAALGYTPLANAQGGYPTGYLVVASRKGITKGATGSAGEPAPRSTVARLLYNALEVPTMEQTVFSEGNEEFEESDKSVLTDALEFEKYEGTVAAVFPKASGDDTEKTRVTIDPVSMLSADLQDKEWDKVKAQAKSNLSKIDVGDTNAADLLGYYVTVYVGEDENTGKDKIFAIAAKTNRNETITIDYSQLDEKTDLAKNVVYYLEKATDKSAKKINLSDVVEFYYNGGEEDDETLEAHEFLTQLEGNAIHPGTVTFVDSLDSKESENGYDYVFVTEYTADYVVDEIDADTETITDIDGNTVDIDLDDENTVYSFEKDGKPATYEDITEGDVLTFAEGEDTDGKDLVKVFISSKTVEGSVAEKRADGDEVYFTIGGKEYRAGVDYDANEVRDDITKVGNEGTFYINVDGRIVYEDASATAGGNYAYLYKAGTKTGTVSDGTVQIKYLTQEGNWETKDLATTITIYEGRESTSGIKPAKLEGADKIAAMNKLFELNDKNEVDAAKQQLIQVKTKADGTVNKLYIAADKQDKNNFSMDYDTKDYYNASKNKIGRVYLKDDIVVFSINTKKADDEEGYTVSTAKATFKDDNEYTIEAFDEDNAGYPSVIVAYDAKAAVSEDTPILVIDRVTTSTNDEGQDILKFYGYQDGEAVQAEGNEDLDDKFENLEAGDVIIFSLDASGKIDEIEVLFTTAQADVYIEKGTAPKLRGGDDVEEAFGQVVKKNTGSRLALDNNEDYPLTGKDVKFYTVNLNRSKTAVAAATYGDVTANTKEGKLGSYVYIRYYDGTAVGCVAYQKDNPEKKVAPAEDEEEEEGEEEGGEGEGEGEE
ncbi:MAG: S-layer homology domain-containing protein [Clostridia bacterium]|nr:S-layer homology domain-containing protein [Clostridia bacterium]